MLTSVLRLLLDTRRVLLNMSMGEQNWCCSLSRSPGLRFCLCLLLLLLLLDRGLLLLLLGRGLLRSHLLPPLRSSSSTSSRVQQKKTLVE